MLGEKAPPGADLDESLAATRLDFRRGGDTYVYIYIYYDIV